MLDNIKGFITKARSFFIKVGKFFMDAENDKKKMAVIIVGVIFLFMLATVINGYRNYGNKMFDSEYMAKVNARKVSPKATPKPIPTEKATATPTLTEKELKEIKEKEKVNDYQQWIDSQFSFWDGSHKELVKYLKENLNDASSFEHVETTYSDNGFEKGITVLMKYRAKNGFGAKMLSYIKAKCDYKTNKMTILEQE